MVETFDICFVVETLAEYAEFSLLLHVSVGVSLLLKRNCELILVVVVWEQRINDVLEESLLKTLTFRPM